MSDISRPTRPADGGAPTGRGALSALAVRLTPGQDLRGELERAVVRYALSAACVVTCVGSLRAASLRLADESLPDPFAGPFEIVSLVGTLGTEGVHLHLSVADATGAVRGGHLRHGSPIHTTAEVVLASLTGLAFSRRPDEATGFRELVITSPPPKKHF